LKLAAMADGSPFDSRATMSADGNTITDVTARSTATWQPIDSSFANPFATPIALLLHLRREGQRVLIGPPWARGGVERTGGKPSRDSRML